MNQHWSNFGGSKTNWAILKIAMFPGMVGVEVANEINSAIDKLGKIDSLVIDLRGNTGGGIEALRVMSLLTPDRIPVGFALDKRRIRADLETEKQHFPRFHGFRLQRRHFGRSH